MYVVQYSVLAAYSVERDAFRIQYGSSEKKYRLQRQRGKFQTGHFFFHFLNRITTAVDQNRKLSSEIHCLFHYIAYC